MKKLISVILLFTMLFSVTAHAETSLQSKIAAVVKDKSGTFTVGVENLETGEKAYVDDQRIRAASVIKVFVMTAAFRKIKAGDLKLTKVVKLQDRYIERVWGTGILQSQPAGYEITVAKLIEYMIMHSDNRAANIMVDMLGMDYINETIQELGFSKDTQLGYYFFVDPPAGASNTVTAKDLNELYKRLYEKKLISPFYDNLMLQFMKNTTNRTKICAKLPSSVVVAHKTGAITSHEHDAGIVFSSGGDFAITVLGHEVPNGQYSYDVISDVAKTVYDYYNSK